jgi:drug/metabolite transporter (DMT)-like permease
MSLRQLRAGELVASVGVVCLVLSLFEPWYEGPLGRLDAWDTFGPAMALLLACLCAALAMLISAVGERSTALPVSSAVWCVLLGLAGLIAAIVRVLERPDHASSLCVGAWLGLAGAAAVLLGAWLALRDERPSLYRPAHPEPRPRP